MKKLSSLILALAMSLSLCVPAFAAEQNVREEHTFNLGDGIIVTVGVEPDDGKMIPRIDQTFWAVANPITTKNYNLVPPDGNYCFLRIRNEESRDSGFDLDVTFQITIGEDTVTAPKQTANPGGTAYIEITSTTGDGLSGRLFTTFKAVNTDSVVFYYSLNQSWR